MERLVVSYTIDCGWDGSFDHVRPVVFESKAKFLAAFEDEVIGYWLQYQEHSEAEARWWKAEPRGTKRADTQAKWAAWYDRKPNMGRSQLFKMNGVEFDAMDFVVAGDYAPPTVQTVDEWFASA